MYRFITLTASVIAATLALAAPAGAHDGGSLLHKDRYLRALVVKVSGHKDAPGCDLIRGLCPKRTRTSKHAYLQTLRRMGGLLFDRPAAPVTQRGYSAPGNVTAGQASYQPSGASSAERFVGCESHGSWTAVNPSSGAYGRYQILPSHWASGQCRGLGRDPGGQTECANRIMATEGSGAWSQCGG